MSPADVIRTYLSQTLVDEDGEPWELELLPGLTEEELAAFEARVGFALPEVTRELLRFTRGIVGGPLEMIDFTSSADYVAVDEDSGFGHKTLGFAADGFGNHWGYVLGPDATDLAPIYYFCHDPPVFLYQSPDLAHFLKEMFKMCAEPFESLVDDVHEDRLKNVWLENPDLAPAKQARQSSDPIMAWYAATVPDHWKLIDLRSPEIGQGFSWGRCRDFKRHDREMIFALDFKEPWTARTWLGRLTGKRKPR